MNYYKNNIRHVKGDTFSSAILVEGLGQPLDSIYFTCRDSLNDDSTVLFEKSLNKGITQVEYDAEKDIRKYAVRVAPSDTRELQAGTYFYDVQVAVNYDVFTIMKGSFIVEQDATRKDDSQGDEIIIQIKAQLDEINGEVVSLDVFDKLDYLEETKSLIKDGLNQFQVGLTEEDTFRSYTEVINELFEEYSVRGEGTKITLNNTKVGKLLLEIVGEAETVNSQIENKNLLDLTKHTNTLAANTTILSPNSCQCEVTGNWQGSIIVPIDLKQNTTYTISAKTGGNATRSIINNIKGYIGDTGTNVVTNQYYDYFKNGYTFNSGEYERYELNLNIAGGSTPTGTLILEELQIEEGVVKTSFFEHQEQNLTLPLEEGQYAYSYDETTHITSSGTVSAISLMKGGN